MIWKLLQIVAVKTTALGPPILVETRIHNYQEQIDDDERETLFLHY
jgi:hypothetical protein